MAKKLGIIVFVIGFLQLSLGLYMGYRLGYKEGFEASDAEWKPRVKEVNERSEKLIKQDELLRKEYDELDKKQTWIVENIKAQQARTDHIDEINKMHEELLRANKR